MTDIVTLTEEIFMARYSDDRYSVIGRCPECIHDVDFMDYPVTEGEQFPCPTCHSTLMVVTKIPLELISVGYVDYIY